MRKTNGAKTLEAVERERERERVLFTNHGVNVDSVTVEFGKNNLLIKSRGITLVALVVTIIVLLILSRNNRNVRV